MYYNVTGGMQWCSWLKHCAMSQKVAGSIPVGVTGILRWRIPSRHTMLLRSTQPVAKISTRNISWEVKAASA